MNRDKVGTRMLHRYNVLKFASTSGAISFPFGTKNWMVTLDVAAGAFKDVRRSAITIHLSLSNTFPPPDCDGIHERFGSTTAKPC